MIRNNSFGFVLSALLAYFALICILLLTFPWRLFVYILARTLIPRFQGFVTGFEQGYCNFEGNSWAPNFLISIFTVQGCVDLEKSRERFRNKFVDKLNGDGELVNPRFRRTFRWFLGYRFWVDVEKFSLEQHVYVWEGRGSEEEISDEGSLKKSLPRILDRSWKKEESPWEVIIVNGYEGRADRSLIIIKSQHALADGTFWSSIMMDWDGMPWEGRASPAYMKLFKTPEHFGLPANAGKMHGPGSRVSKLQILRRHFSTGWRVLNDTGLYFATKKNIICKNLEMLKFWECSGSPENFTTSPAQYVNFSAPYPIETIKSIKNKYGVGFNSVVLSVVGGSVRKLVENVHGKVPEGLPICFALPKLCHPGLMVNHFLCATCDLPLQPDSAAERLLSTDKALSRFQDCYAPIGIDCLFSVCGLMPGRLRDRICRTFINPGILCSTFPVLGKDVTFDSFLVSDLIVLHGSTRKDLGLSILVAGCENMLRFSLVLGTKVDFPPDANRQLEDFIQQELLDLLGNDIESAPRSPCLKNSSDFFTSKIVKEDFRQKIS